MPSFEDVDHKLAECGFFLEKLEEAGANVFEAECYFVAFSSAARSVTLTLQAALAGAPGFALWWDQQRDRMRNDSSCRWFLQARNANVHTGHRLLSAGLGYKSTDGHGHVEHFAGPGEDGSELDMDVVTASQRHLDLLQELAKAAFDHFPRWADADWIFETEHLLEAGLTVEDLEEQLGFPRGWTAGIPLEARLRLLAES